MALRFVELIDEIRSSESIISEEMLKKENAKSEIEELLKNIYSPFKKYIAEKLFENFSDDYKAQVLEYRKMRKGPKTGEKWLTSASISTIDDNICYSEATFCSGYFDPDIDAFDIYSYEFNEDMSKIKITVECLKNRQYLGITGAWIPSFHSTDWLDVSEVEEKEK